MESWWKVVLHFFALKRSVMLASLLAACLLVPVQFEGGEQVYTLESVNDPGFVEYPPPGPTSPLRHEFEITDRVDERLIEVRSRRHRNLSITLENRGTGLIRSPHLFGPHGWDFRSLEAIGEAVTDSPGLTRDEKFFRVHEWKGLHVAHVTGSSYLPYVDKDFSANPLRILNQYGHAMCGQSTMLVNTLLREVPPVGSMYGRSVKLGTHRVGEAYWGGAWHAFDTTPGTGVVQWVYYDSDNLTIAPTWQYLIERPSLVSRIIPYTNATSIDHYIEGATGETFAENRSMPEWDFNFDLRPRESLTMYFDMRGRIDQYSMRQGNSGAYRGYSDYASAVFQYKPDLTTSRFRDYRVHESNIRTTSSGLVPVDPLKPSFVVFDMRSVWCFVGATIKASFKTNGRVYVATRADPYDMDYSTGIAWQRLSSSSTEYGEASIEGKMAFWVKFEFQGTGSGLNAADISAEVQMSRSSMPGLEYGWNRIRFEAEDMGGSPLRVTYRYDDRSPFHLYEPATSRYGRHVPIRIGGVLDKGSSLSRLDYGKARFWDRLHEMPDVEARVLVEIIKVSGDRAGQNVRTLVNDSLPWGWYEFYWDGKDDSGRKLPRGMYAYKLSIDGKLIHGARLYLYETIWPLPNEVAGSGPEEKAELVSGGLRKGDANSIRIEDVPGNDWGDLVGGGPHAVAAVAGDAAGFRLNGGPDEQGGGAGVESPMLLVSEEHGGSDVRMPAMAGEPETILDAGRTLPLLVTRLEGIASHGAPRKPGARVDRLRLDGVLPGLPAGWDPAGLEVLLDAGGAKAEVLLDGKGRGLDGSALLKLRLERGAGGAFAGGDVPFTLRLSGDLAGEWLDEGVDPWEDETDTPISFRARLELAGRTFEATVRARLTSTAGEGGRFVFPGT